MRTEAKQAKQAPIRFKSMNPKFLFVIFPAIFKIQANNIKKTPANPIQSIVLIEVSLL